MKKDVIENRYDFVVFYDVENGNPNGDPSSGNMPRIDIDTGLGYVTDVCIKRKIRDYVDRIKMDEPRFRIYIKSGASLNSKDKEAFKACGIDEKMLKSKAREYDMLVRDWMCQNFYDIRTFGGVMTTFTKNGLNCGQIQGPVQIGFSKSVEPVYPKEITVIRDSITTEEDNKHKTTEIGRKYVIPYGLYSFRGYICPLQAKIVTGFTENDLDLLWQAIFHMFDSLALSSRGYMTVRKLIVFKHDSPYGNAPSWKLFNTVKVERISDSSVPARQYEDYIISIDREGIPECVEVQEMI